MRLQREEGRELVRLHGWRGRRGTQGIRQRLSLSLLPLLRCLLLIGSAVDGCRELLPGHRQRAHGLVEGALLAEVALEGPPAMHGKEGDEEHGGGGESDEEEEVEDLWEERGEGNRMEVE